MSLINQMLRDLDARHAPAADRPALQGAVRATSQRNGGTWPMLALASALIAALAVGAWFWRAGRGASAPVPQPQVSLPQPEPAPAPVAPAAAVRAELPPPAAAPAQRHPAAAEHGAPAKGAAAANTGKVAKAAHSQTKAVAADLPSAPAGATVEAAAPAAEGSIDKRPHSALAAEAAEGEYNKAVFALRRGANAEAAEHLRAALRIDMLHVSARQALLSLLMRQQQWDEAQTLAEEGLAFDPTQTSWAIALARLQMEHGKLAEAADTLAHYAAYAERNADYQAFHALLLQKQKRYAEAADRYSAAVALRPTEARWWYGLGLSLEAEQKPQEAHEAFLRAREAGNLPPELAGSLHQHLR